jgi:curved DNA-binding protein CbpA
MASRFHPDHPATGDSEKFLLLKHAYEVLSDPERRAEYDAKRESREVRPNPIFEMSEFVNGIEGETNRRLGVLSLLYTRRRTNPEDPRISLRSRKADGMVSRVSGFHHVVSPQHAVHNEARQLGFRTYGHGSKLCGGKFHSDSHASQTVEQRRPDRHQRRVPHQRRASEFRGGTTLEAARRILKRCRQPQRENALADSGSHLLLLAGD